MPHPLQVLLDAHPVLLADGATGTTLFAMGLPAGEAPELWNELRPDAVHALAQEFIDAGSDIVLTNSFGGNRYRLALHGREGDAQALNRQAASIARAAASQADRPVLVAGSMGPTGEILAPVGPLAFEDAVGAFVEQGRGLLEGGAEVLWGETISSREEATALAEAARRLDAPYCITLSFDTAGRTMMGVAPSAAARLAAQLPHPPVAVGANCGTGAADLLAAVAEMVGADVDIPVIAKANAGIPAFVDGAVVYGGTPALMARYACLARDLGARIIGGCCGSRGVHLTAMREALATQMRRPPPDRAAIEAATGPFVQAAVPVAGRGHAHGGRRRRRANPA